jgi:hypothetical protein
MRLVIRDSSLVLSNNEEGYIENFNREMTERIS